MSNYRPQESERVTQARRTWTDLSDQYRREVGLATDPLTSIEVRVSQMSLEKHAELVTKINAARQAYYDALEEDGRNTPHR